MTVSCASVVGASNVLVCQELVGGDLTWNFTPENYHDNNLAPGNYVYTFDVSTGSIDVSTGSTTALTK